MIDGTEGNAHQLTEEEQMQELLDQLRLNNSSMVRSSQLCEKTRVQLDTIEQKILTYEDNLNKILEDIASKKSNFFTDVKRIVLYAWKRKQKKNTFN